MTFHTFLCLIWKKPRWKVPFTEYYIEDNTVCSCSVTLNICQKNVNITVEFRIPWKHSSDDPRLVIFHSNSFHLCRKPFFIYRMRRNASFDMAIKFPLCIKRKSKNRLIKAPGPYEHLLNCLPLPQVLKGIFLVQHNQTIRVWWCCGIKQMRICRVNTWQEVSMEPVIWRSSTLWTVFIPEFASYDSWEHHLRHKIEANDCMFYGKYRSVCGVVGVSVHPL